MRSTAKILFKKIGFSHWDESAKVVLLLIAIMIPFCFLFIVAILGMIFSVINYFYRLSYNNSMHELETQQREIMQ